MYYSNNSHDQSVQVVNDTNFDGIYILTNLSPYTVYSIYVTAVRLIGGDNDRPLEGMRSEILTERTLAGSESKLICKVNPNDFHIVMYICTLRYVLLYPFITHTYMPNTIYLPNPLLF